MTSDCAAIFLPVDDMYELVEAGTWLLDVIAAVDFLRRGHRPGFTVWDAIEEALRTPVPSVDDSGANSADPLRDSLGRLLASTSTPVAVALQAAIRRWVEATADRFNNGHHWPHPAPRRGFPPPLLNTSVDYDAP